MLINDYQTEAHDYARYNDWLYPVLGLASEAGEVCGKVKKLLRDKNIVSLSGLCPDDRRALLSELGDVMWYIQEIAGALGADLDHVAQLNLTKLSGRAARGTLGGSGDER